ncbi:hypothetical protein [Prosthecobacter sp.]|uniref:hypothetical protein n=1 Tax=Prosthecobacter sp. TaxID=1965333 RepID=UPI002AB9744D|nr:hypothetical protein [Prosthecobacter sp.]MDZ4401776.1 hypothetical protein [Prosthecobacter sp.]
MNIPTLPDLAADARLVVDPVLNACAKPAAQAEKYIRQHPGGTLLVAAGLGIVAVLLARALTPAPPRNRALRLLEDIQERLASLAEDGAHAVGKGMDSLGDLHLDRSFDKLSRKFKGLFH